MSSERHDVLAPEPISRQPGESQGNEAAGRPADNTPRQDNAPRQGNDTRQEAIVVVRGETVQKSDQAPGQKSTPDQNSPSAPKDSQPKDKEKAPRKEVSEAKVKKQSRLPALDDDSDIGVQKEHIVTRDGKADLTFTGTLLASAAPPSAPKGKWKEYRIYQTTGGKHVFSKVSRTVYAEDQDAYEAEVFDPNPSSVPSQLLRTARDLTRSKPLTWMDAAVAFFGFDPTAKILYRKLGGQFEEHVS